MSYFRKRPMSGFGDWAGVSNASASDYCAARGYATTGEMVACVNAIQAGKMPAAPGAAGTASTPASSSSSGSFFTDIFKAFTAPAVPPGQTIIMQPSSGGSGISTTTLLVAGGATILLVALLARR